MMSTEPKSINILGIRGIPAAHGGFETFAGNLAPYLRSRGWNVNVYCQLDPLPDGSSQKDFEDEWNGIHRIHLATKSTGSRGSIEFDWRCVLDASKRPGLDLVLGYNTAVFVPFLRMRGKKVIMNMDGVEWRRDKWSLPIKAWFYLNEFVGVNVVNLPVADHPEIAAHLRRHTARKMAVIPYGADVVVDAPLSAVSNLGLLPREYFLSIARIEPENSILEIVEAFSLRPRKSKLVVLGNLSLDNKYHQRVRAAASEDVLFTGAIYDQRVVRSLRFYASAYLHGHQVGGTNPSLVEALGAGSAVIAHDNRFNKWVAGGSQLYFKDAKQLETILTEIENHRIDLGIARTEARLRHSTSFTIDGINAQYEELFLPFVQSSADIKNSLTTETNVPS
jgi:glycosyltransferase involved in cell wall biosynthesis